MKFAKKTKLVKPGMTEQELADILGEYYMEDLDIADAEEMSRFDAMGTKLVRIYACNIFTVDVGMENGTVKSIKVENVWKKNQGYSDFVDPEVFWREIYKPGYFSD